MASRTTASVGMMVSVAVFSLLSLGLFITTIVFVAKVQRLEADKQQALNDLADAVRTDERGDRWEELKRLSGNKGVVRYLDESIQSTMRLVTGTERDTVDSLRTKITNRFGEDSPALFASVSDLDRRVIALQQERDREQQARERIENTLRTTNDRLAEVQRQYAEAVARNNEAVESYTGKIDTYRTDLDTTVGQMRTSITNLRQDSDATIASLESEIDDLQAQILIKDDQIRRLRGEQRSQVLQAPDEAALVDGRVIAVNPATRQVSLDRGRRDRMVLGLLFEIFDRGTSITLDSSGNYPTGKATIEVIRIDEGTSVARIIRETRGNPIVDGDIIVNPVYDPKKSYSFAVFGNFDTNGDGTFTSQETEDIRAIISGWGGTVTDTITGETDFLVLGKKPVLPPEPKPEDPVELIQRYLLLKQTVSRYDDLFNIAVQTGVPVLNQNRLFTLTGLHAEPR